MDHPFALESPEGEELASGYSPEAMLLAARTMAVEEVWPEGAVTYVCRKGSGGAHRWVMTYRLEAGVFRPSP